MAAIEPFVVRIASFIRLIGLFASCIASFSGARVSAGPGTRSCERHPEHVLYRRATVLRHIGLVASRTLSICRRYALFADALGCFAASIAPFVRAIASVDSALRSFSW
jgi:hypothetical protein